jgi:hypothetical protein
MYQSMRLQILAKKLPMLPEITAHLMDMVEGLITWWCTRVDGLDTGYLEKMG